MVFSALTVALFEFLSEGAADWYFENIGVVGAAAVPVAGTYLYDAVFRRHTGIPSVLARVFAPLFLAMTGTYLVMALLGGQNPFVDRSFLITQTLWPERWIPACSVLTASGPTSTGTRATFFPSLLKTCLISRGCYGKRA